MKKFVLRSVFVLLIPANTALACVPDPEFAYDDATNVDIAIATAVVTSVEIKNTEIASCWQVQYSNARYYLGQGAEGFSVTTCADKVYQEDALAEQVEGLESLGFKPNAEVLLGVVHLGENASKLRYAIPSCWGPMHVDLGQMSAEERAEFLDNLERQFDEKK